MSKLFFSVISWAAFAVIYASEVLRVDGLGTAPVAAAWYVYLLNAGCVLVLFAAFSESARASWRDDWFKRSILHRGYGVISSLAWLGLLGYIGWMWSFGLFALSYIALYSVRAKEAA